MQWYWLIVLCLMCVLPSRSQSPEILNERSKELLAKKKYAKAWPVLKEAAKLGHPEAQYNLGHAYETGEFIVRSPSSSAEWYAKSAEQDYTEAIYKMMMAYKYGFGVDHDPERAFDFARKCAAQGNIECMQYLVGCYQEGLATDKDPDKMVEWTILLGKQENPEDYKGSTYVTDARLNLANWYLNGEHVKEDYFKSYMWFLLFNESKKDLSYFRQRKIIKQIKGMEKVLDPGEILQAKVEAEVLLGRPLRNVDRLFDAEY